MGDQGVTRSAKKNIYFIYHKPLFSTLGNFLGFSDYCFTLACIFSELKEVGGGIFGLKYFPGSVDLCELVA